MAPPLYDAATRGYRVGEFQMLHAILRWDAGDGETPICGADVAFMFKTHQHVYVTCPSCRAHTSFKTPRDMAPWPLPETVAESTAQLVRMREEGLY